MSTPNPSNERYGLAQWRMAWISDPHGHVSHVGYDTRDAAEAAIAKGVADGGPAAIGLYRLEREWVQQPNYVERVPHPDAP